jgi:ATP-binding cassette subfamily C protein LapB
MSVALYALGAVLVVGGSLTVGALIGANILGSRAFQSMVRFVQTHQLISRAKEASEELREFMTLPREAERGTALRQYRGSLGFRDVSFAYPGSRGPLFESLNLDLEPGNIVVVAGRNGAGKTTLAKLIVGLLFPSRGEILVDGMSLRQVAPGWWRRQIMYFPQEPTFIVATLRENLTMMNPAVEEAELNRVVKLADLRPFLDRTPDGLETRLPEGGRHLSLGIRRRLALARALVTNGALAVFDEPTEGLDSTGCEAVYQVLNVLVRAGKTIVAFSNDPLITKAAQVLLDLNQKPVPKVVRVAVEGKEAQGLRLKAGNPASGEVLG